MTISHYFKKKSVVLVLTDIFYAGTFLSFIARTIWAYDALILSDPDLAFHQTFGTKIVWK